MFDIEPISLYELSKLVNGVAIGIDCLLNAVYLNSKEIPRGNSCFISIKGENFDADDFVGEAEMLGARAIITSKKIESKIPYIIVDDTRKALCTIAKRNIKNTKIIGITGSVGKTTTKNMITSVLKQKYAVCGTKENENNEIGVAKTLLNIKNHEFCVVEMGMRALSEIEFLSSVASPETAVLTNIGTAHIERLGSKENIFKAKMEILNSKPRSFVSPYYLEYEGFDFGKTRTYFVGKDTVCNAKIINTNREFTEFVIVDAEYISKIMKIYSLNLANIQNALLTYKVGKLYGLTDDEIGRGIQNFKLDKMREEHKFLGNLEIINDAYNASLESVISAIETSVNYGKMTGKKVNLLLGDLLEIEGYEEEIYSEISSCCKKNNIDKIYLFGERIKILNTLLNNKATLSNSAEELSRIIIKEINGEKDLLLVKASRKVQIERVIREMRDKYNE